MMRERTDASRTPGPDADRGPAGLWYRRADMESGKQTATRFGALDASFPAFLTTEAHPIWRTWE
jgi:hypothetical protein